MKKILALTMFFVPVVAGRADVVAYWPFGVSGLTDTVGNYAFANTGAEVGSELVFDGNQSMFHSTTGIDMGTTQKMTVEICPLSIIIH